MSDFADTNFMEMSLLEEDTFGEIPSSGTPATLRIRGQSLNYAISSIRSEEINSDRMTSDLIQVDAENAGNIEVEMSYKNADELIQAVLMGTWTSLASEDVTDIVSSTSTLNVADSTGFVAGQLVKLSGFTESDNNQVTEVDSVTGTTIVVTSSTLADEDPATGSVNVVGLVGGTGDIEATASGLISTTLDFTDFGLIPGDWIKIGGSDTSSKFDTSANNGWARIESVGTNAIIFDRNPSGLSIDDGDGKNIQLFFGEKCKNGLVKRSFSIQRDHTDVNQVFMFRGIRFGQATFNIQTGSILTADFVTMGQDAVLDSSNQFPSTPASQSTGDIMNSVGDIVQILINNSTAGTIQSMTLDINNNLRGQKAVQVLGNAGVGYGDVDTTGELVAYFEDDSIYTMYLNNQEMGLSFVVVQDGQAYVIDVPRAKIESCEIQAGQRNEDVTLQMTYRGLRHAALSEQTSITRVPYYEE